MPRTEAPETPSATSAPVAARLSALSIFCARTQKKKVASFFDASSMRAQKS